MDPLYLRKLRIERQINPQNTNNGVPNNAEEALTDKQNPVNIKGEEAAPLTKENPTQQTNLRSQSEQLMKDMRDEMLNPRQMKMNYLASMERSDYVKKVMNLPRTLPELLIQLQNPNYAKGIQNVWAQTIPQPDSHKPVHPSDVKPEGNPQEDIPHDGEQTRPEGNKPHDVRPNRPDTNVLPNVRPNHPGGNRPPEVRPNHPGHRPHNPNPGKDDVPNRIIDNYGNIRRDVINHRNRENIIANQLNNPLHNNMRPHEHKPHFGIQDPPPPPIKEGKKDEAMANLYANLAMNDVNNPTLTQMRQRLSDDAIELLFTGLINLNELSQTMKHNGHDARTKLILAMANASRQGIDNSQIAATMKQVAESMAAEENNPSSILKNIIMLYLPWYPLQQGVGFNLSIETMEGASDFSSLLKVFIQTRNYGNVNGSLILMSGNTVDMNIQCNDNFPQEDLLDRMKDVTDNNSVRSNITVEERAQFENEMANQQAKVNLSATYELNPYLLLMAHSFIKNTIIIDNGAAA